MGNLPCEIPHSRISNHFTVPNDTQNQVNEFEVPAGKWVTRIMSDSHLGKNFMCHTLYPNTNVTVNFEKSDGTSIAIKFNEKFRMSVPYINVLIHDRHEHVSLPSFALDSMEMMTVLTRDDKSVYASKLRGIIKPSLLEMPKPSKLLPCSIDPTYSQNWCQIQWGWEKKNEVMKNHFASKFNCILPGIFTNMTDKLPICQNDDRDPVNDTLGFNDLMIKFSGSRNHHPLLTNPPIGIYKSNSGCISRCSHYDYSMQIEEANDYNVGFQR